MKNRIRHGFVAAIFAACACEMASAAGALSADSERGPVLRALFLGDNGHHRPQERFKQLQPVLAPRGIELVYTDSLDDLSPGKLAGFDCLVIYANHTAIAADQEKALLDFVTAGGGLVPLHCASYCFLNSPRYIELVGGQFKSHGNGVFRETIVKSDHPLMKGLAPIESWDETYVHTRHNPNRVVLAERREGEGSQAEPYTWVRESGKGRVFYTAWGHDERTWSNTRFQALVENGIRWASANSPRYLKPHTALKPFEYEEAPAPLPNYVAGARWGTQAEPIRTMQKPLDPAESMKHLVMLPGFEARLFASEPDVIKPIWLAWDERGRLWIAETIDYPNEMQNIGQGRDQLKICEDTNGDGRADKFTVFADKLSVPTGFVFARGGVIVVHSGQTELLRDTDGDDKVDDRQTLFQGWGTGDTHAGPSNLRYSFDNWIWGVVGYSGFQGTVGGKELRFGQGIFRFKPDGSALEFIRSSNNNTWGLGLSEEGIVFGSTANGNASMYMPIPNRYYEAVNGWSASRLESIADSQNFYPITDKVRQVDWHGKYTAGAGSALYTARAFPKEYWNRAQFVAEPTGHLLGMFHLEPRGANFIAHNQRNFAASDDEWTSPVAAEVGPDGALWVSDWYNYIIQHNPTPQGFKNGKGNAYETPLRDKVHGRIYRITHRESESGTRPRESSRIRALDAHSTEQLLGGLRSDNLLWRMHAQRLLVEREQKDVVPALCKLIEDTSRDEIGLNAQAIHALWTLHGLGALDNANAQATTAVQEALKHPSAGVRRTAVTVLPRTEAGREALLSSKLVDDPDAQVRLAALLASSEMPVAEVAGAAVYSVFEDPRNAGDAWITDAAVAGAARHEVGFLRTVLNRLHPTKPVTNNGASGADVKEVNLISNPSFEEEKDGRPAGWRTAIYGGKAEHSMAQAGRSGKHSVKIVSQEGSDASWSTPRIAVKPRTEYRLSAWIRTEGVVKGSRGARGALLNVHELQDPEGGATKPLLGDNDWTRVELNFNTGQLTEITINCLFGGWGAARGAAWYDDIELTQSAGSLLAGELGRAIRLVTAHYAQRGPVESIVPTLLALQGASAAIAGPILDGLVAGWPQAIAPTLGDREKEKLTELIQALPQSAQDRLLALVQRWGQPEIFGSRVQEITDTLKRKVTDSEAPDEERMAAANRLLGLQDKAEIVRLLLQQITLLTPPGLAGGLVSALTESRRPDTAEALIQSWGQLTPTVRRSAVGTLMRRPEWTRSLLEAVEKRVINSTDLAPEQWAQLRRNPNRGLAQQASRLSAPASSVSADREEVVRKLLPLAKESGNAARGKEVFAANCANCHVLNGEGGKIGPDLTGIGSRDRADVLLEILDPNRSVEMNYRSWSVTTKTGETYSGRLDAETQTTVEILDILGQKHVIQRKEMANLEGSALSLMPGGFETLPADDLKALLEYLARPHPTAN